MHIQTRAVIRWFKEHWPVAILGFGGGLVGYFVSEAFL